MKIKITKNCPVSVDGISVIKLKVGDTPDLPEDLAKIVVKDMKSGEYIQSVILPEDNKKMMTPPQNKAMPVPENKGDNEPDTTVYELAKSKNISYKKIIKIAKSLHISATHGNSKLTGSEVSKILNKLHANN